MEADHQRRRLSVASIVNPSGLIDAHDEKVLIAVSALGDMRNLVTSPPSEPGPSSSSYWDGTRSFPTSSATPSLSRASTSSRATSPTNIDEEEARSVVGEDERSKDPDRLLTRVSNLPLVNSAIRAYDYSKASSRVINYGAGLVESSVKTITQPVIDRLPVEQLDDFACRQLDRFGYGGKADSPEPLETTARPSAGPSSPEESSSGAAQNEPPDNQVTVASRRGWQTVLVEASGISAAISEENMKRLRYCLQWLQYATARIDQQITVLQTFLSTLDSQMSADPGALVPMTAMRTLTEVKRDVISTVRQVVEVMSQYAGGALPEQARATVRSFILLLPERWATAMRQQEEELGTSSANEQDGEGMGVGIAQRASKRVLTLASESLDMMKGATGVFKDSLERAEAWVERLRIVGIQRQRQRQLGPNAKGQAPLEPGIDSPGVTLQGLTLSHGTPLGSRRASTLDPEEEELTERETEGEGHPPESFQRGNIRRRQRRRVASPSPAGAVRLRTGSSASHS